jgi:cytoskeletal protein CcmA (bactofilin family)
VQDQTNPAKPAADDAQPSPRIELSAVGSELKPPAKPFRARPLFKSHLFTAAPANRKSGGSSMSDRFSSDRMAAFSPQIPRRVADIPNPAAVRAAEAESEGKRLLVGKQIRMTGEIAGAERLVVEGQVDATLSDVKTIEVTASGGFKGSARVDSAVIAGTYEGSLTVNGHLEIAASGVVKGSVTYKTIMVANGGRVEGTIVRAEG